MARSGNQSQYEGADEILEECTGGRSDGEPGLWEWRWIKGVMISFLRERLEVEEEALG